MPSFNRILLLALLYLTVFTAAVPVLDADDVAGNDALEARGRTVRARPAPARPRPKPRPAPRPTQTKRPVVVKKPVPTRKPVLVPTRKPVPVPTRKPVPIPGKHTTTTAHPTTTARPTTTALPHGGNTTTPHGASCPVTSKPTKPTKPTKPRELLEYVSSFFLTKRATPEFVGWHGTNSATADVWHRAGYLKKPWSWMDIIGQRRTGGSGADQELGPGVYVTDSLRTAEGFAVINAGQAANQGTVAMLCAIFAHDSATWRGYTPKAWLPGTLIGDSSNAARHQQYEEERLRWLQRVYPTVHPSDVVRFAPLDHNRGHPPGQLLIPASRTRDFYAVCLPAQGGRIPAGAPSGDINYDTARTAWHILDRTCV